MTQILKNSILNLNIRSSLQHVLDNFIPNDVSLAMINYNFDNKEYNFNNRFSVYSFLNIDKATLQNAMTREVDYFIIFNKKLNEKHYKIIHNILVNDRSVILVECDFDRKKLQEEIGHYEFFKIDKIVLKEKMESF